MHALSVSVTLKRANNTPMIRMITKMFKMTCPDVLRFFGHGCGITVPTFFSWAVF